MKYAKAYLWFVGLMFISFGVGFLLAPNWTFFTYTGSSLLTSSAATDIRAHNGGLGIGAGIWLLCCLKGHIRFGLVGIAIIHAVIAASRMLGFALDGEPNMFMVFFLLVELSLAAGAGLILYGMRAETAERDVIATSESKCSMRFGMNNGIMLRPDTEGAEIIF